ncbi:hypothetical protein BH11PLA2_BH11PLA2_32820 [soil metagenome]
MNAADWTDLDISDDLATVDGLETVELRRLAADGSYAAAVDVRAVREVPSGKHIALFAEAVDLVFSIIASDYPTTIISRGDTITDAGGLVWVVTAARLGGIQDQFLVGTTQSPALVESP